MQRLKKKERNPDTRLLINTRYYSTINLEMG